MFLTPKHAMSKHSANCTLDWPTPVRANRLSGQNPQSTCIVARPGLATRSGDQCVRCHSIFHPMSLFSMTFHVLLDPVNVFVYEVPRSIHTPNHDSDLP